MNYLIDENTPPHLIRAIANLHSRDYHDDKVLSMPELKFAGIDDANWIASLVQSAEAWTVITRDLMRRERALLRSDNLTWFLLNRGWASFPYWELSWKLVKAWPEMVTVGRRQPGQVFTVAVNGRVRQER